MSAERLVILWEKYLSDSMSLAERAELQHLGTDPIYQPLLEQLVQSVFEENRFVEKSAVDKEMIFQRVLQSAYARQATVAPVHRIHFLRKWGWVAACILLLLGTGLYFWINKTGSHNLNQVQQVIAGKDISPGKDGAILRLADGSQIVLDSLGNGIVADQAGVQVMLDNGQLAYHATGENASSISWNTMFTPRGRQFRLVLPDGSKVWLNAASSIRYPTQFIGSERSVEVTGEVYLEVAKNKQQPFKVMLPNETEVTVLGTHFNINAYADEPAIKTTLLEGNVKVSKDRSAQILQPNQQAIVQDVVKINKSVDIEQVMAWKNGRFNFDHVMIEQVMRQLARWYNIDVIYKGKIPDIEFRGGMGRNLTLNQVLESLQLTGVNFELNDHVLMVAP